MAAKCGTPATVPKAFETIVSRECYHAYLRCFFLPWRRPHSRPCRRDHPVGQVRGQHRRATMPIGREVRDPPVPKALVLTFAVFFVWPWRRPGGSPIFPKATVYLRGRLCSGCRLRYLRCLADSRCSAETRNRGIAISCRALHPARRPQRAPDARSTRRTTITVPSGF